MVKLFRRPKEPPVRQEPGVAAAEAPKLGVWLPKNVAHLVDGERVFYPYEGLPDEPDDAFHELAVGKHIINNKLVHVIPPLR